MVIWITFVKNHSGANHSIKYSSCCGCWEFSAYITKVRQWSGNFIYISQVFCGTYLVALVCCTNDWFHVRQ